MRLIVEYAPTLGVAPLCAALGVPRASFYRAIKPPQPATESPRARPSPPRALSQEERQEVLDTLHQERFVDRAPPEVAATLLDEGVVVCSIRTMYRILAANHEVRERRAQARHPPRDVPRLCATGPNQVWSWDITRIKVVAGWLYLYVILDIYSRYVVGWLLASSESAALTRQLIEQTCCRLPPSSAPHFPRFFATEQPERVSPPGLDRVQPKARGQNGIEANPSPRPA